MLCYKDKHFHTLEMYVIDAIILVTSFTDEWMNEGNSGLLSALKFFFSDKL